MMMRICRLRLNGAWAMRGRAMEPSLTRAAAAMRTVGNAATRSLKCSCVLDGRISVCGHLSTVYQVATGSPCVPLRIVLPAGRRPHGRALATAMRVERTRQGRTPDAAPVGPVSQASISEMGALPQAADVGVSPDFSDDLKSYSRLLTCPSSRVHAIGFLIPKTQ